MCKQVTKKARGQSTRLEECTKLRNQEVIKQFPRNLTNFKSKESSMYNPRNQARKTARREERQLSTKKILKQAGNC